ncbi:MAG: Gfo/Idh/MocA family oxidoreductase [Planctomycetaceae bacterium]|jgi:predicted dehydrogenase|nr:Gfo/Idh/MocA family oxidoreductase [Planctomycetaceae bacterium]
MLQQLQQKTSRRNFLKSAAVTVSVPALTVSTVAVPMLIPRTVFADVAAKRPGANERIGVAGIGVGRQGSGVFNAAANDKRTEIICVCDVWKKRAEEIAAKYKLAPEFAYQDYRNVIDNKNVDAIVTATPEHWRSLICVNAALAGKHLYVEKPITLTIEDGVLMRKAVQKTGIVFQCGSMQRSMVPNYLGCKFIREGHLGKITEVISANYESPWFCNLPEEKIPEGLDWNLWCGPTEPVPFHSQLFVPRGNPGWLSFRNYSGGEMTGWGTHGFDQIQCALGMDDTGPVEILVEGEILQPPTYDKPESAKRGNDICSKPKLAYRYKNGLTVRLAEGNRGGGIFIGEKGKVEIFRNKMTSNPKELAENWLKANADVKLPSHVTDWINCIYSGEKTIGNLETGIRTATICHILNIARYLGRNLKWDPVKEEFPNDAEANSWLRREHRKGFEQPTV